MSMWRLSTAGYIPMVSNPYYLSAGGSVEQDSTRNVSNTGHLCLHYYFFARLPSVSKISKHLVTLPTPFFIPEKGQITSISLKTSKGHLINKQYLALQSSNCYIYKSNLLFEKVDSIYLGPSVY